MDDPTADATIAALRQVAVFSKCTDYELGVVARKADVRSYGEGDRIITKGDDGTELMIVLEGGARAEVDGEVRNTFGPGDYFGELSALAPAPRTSDVVATTPTRVAALGNDQVMTLLHAIPDVAPKMLAAMAEKLRSRIEEG